MNWSRQACAALAMLALPTVASAQCGPGWTLVDETEEEYICERVLHIPGPAELADAVERASISLTEQIRGLIAEIQAQRKPQSGLRRTVHEGVILGLTNTPYDADQFRRAERSPFSGRSYEEMAGSGDAIVVAFGTEGQAAEIARGIADNLAYGRYSMSSEVAAQVIPSLEGTHFKRLIAHSNGATTAEALIRAGVITVEELNVVGGDRSLANFRGYEQMLTSGLAKRVKVWLNPGDPIPMISSTALSWPLRNVAMRLADGLTGRNAGGDAEPEVYVLKPGGSPGNDFGQEAHSLTEAYFPFMPEGYERSGHGR